MKLFLRKIGFSIFVLLFFSFISAGAQQLNEVQEKSGRLIFKSFIPTDKSNSDVKNYERLKQWAKKDFLNKRSVMGIRNIDDKQSIIVSLKENISGDGISFFVSYKIDVKVSNIGIFFTIRDVIFENKDSIDLFKDFSPAELVISNRAIDELKGDKRKLNENIKQLTVKAFNSHFDSLKGYLDR